MLDILQDREYVTFLVPEVGFNFLNLSLARVNGGREKGIEDLKLELEDLKRRWQDGHMQLVLLEAAGDRTHVVVQRERKLRRVSGSALDLQLAATKKRVRVS